MLNYARGQFSDRDASPYAVESHRRFMARWLGEPQDWSMCFGWSPTAAALVAPLMVMPTPVAWAVFCATSAILFLWAATPLAAASRAGPRLIRLAAASPCAVFIIGNGQTSLLTTAALLAGLRAMEDGRGTWRIDAALGVGLALLTFKPPLAILAGAALLAVGRWRSVVLGSACAAAVVATTTLWFGPAWMGDYLHLLTRYDTDSCDPIFRAGFAPWFMSNLRSVSLIAGMPDRAASSISSACFLIACAAIAIVPLATRRPMPPRMAVGLATLAYLVFSPHLTAGEDLAILIPACAVLGAAPKPRHASWVVGGCLLIFFLGAGAAWLAPRTFIYALGPILGFAGKLLVGASFLGSSIPSRTRT